ncbi:MAG TPA: hypothetical protein VK464_27780 [Symbiobacteriaceae bacterium]|nr:hypothetical protein [Symbiobacteriaceae bacterium]
MPIVRPMKIERLRQVGATTPEDFIRLLYDKVGNFKRVADYAAERYNWSREQTREVLDYDIQVRKANSQPRGRRRAKTVGETVDPDAIAEAQRLYAASGSEERVAEFMGISKAQVKRYLNAANANAKLQAKALKAAAKPPSPGSSKK